MISKEIRGNTDSENPRGQVGTPLPVSVRTFKGVLCSMRASHKTAAGTRSFFLRFGPISFRTPRGTSKNANTRRMDLINKQSPRRIGPKAARVQNAYFVI